MARRYIAMILCFSVVLSCGLTARAGGNLLALDLTGFEPAPFGYGFFKGRFVDQKWDARSIPVQFTLDNDNDPIPNPNGPSIISLATAKATVQKAMDSWNGVPTSYSKLQLTSEGHSSAGGPGFDMVNEIAFRRYPTLDVIGISLGVYLVEDSYLNYGDDLDGDGDSDVSATITVATDIDNDGDIEFPAGFYKAGTILDSDVYINTDDYTFSANDADLGNFGSFDLQAIATHELGHSQGLSHSMDNQISDTDGRSATMFPGYGWDADNIRGVRALGTDDQTWISYTYPEGSASSGPAALQRGDVAFNDAYGLIKGELRHGWQNEPLLGGCLYAIDKQTGRRVVSGFSGLHTQFYTNLNDSFYLEESFLDRHYILPVPKGDYIVGIEPVDDRPVSWLIINLPIGFGAALGQNDFNEQFYDTNNSAALPSDAKSIHVNAGQTVDHIDITTAKNINISNYGELGFYVFINHVIIAQRIPGAQIAAASAGQDILIQAAAFHTRPVDESISPVFAEAVLTTGVVNPNLTATIDLNNPLDRTSRFVGQDDDFAPFYFHNPKQLGEKIRAGIATNEIQDLFILLRGPDGPFPGPSGLPPVIAFDDNPKPLLNSYASFDNGQTFFPIIFNLRASLWVSATN
jgi:hypothetical protein